MFLAHIKKVLCIQIKLLNCGMVTEAMLVENQVTELVTKYSSFENIPPECLAPISKYEKLAHETLGKFNKLTIKLYINNSNMVTFLQRV